MLPEIPLHVTHRGNRHGQIFFDDADRLTYLQTLNLYGSRFGMDLWAYALMTNHVHLLVWPRERTALAKTVGNAHRAHSERVNRRHGWCGHLWANRYFSTVLDEAHLWCAVRYIELNPVRAGLAQRAEDYLWSSAAAHCGLTSDPWLAAGTPFPGSIEDWPAWLAQFSDPNAESLLRANSRTGRPTGTPEFIESLERQLDRRLTPGTGGRPQRVTG